MNTGLNFGPNSLVTHSDLKISDKTDIIGDVERHTAKLSITTEALLPMLNPGPGMTTKLQNVDTLMK